MNETAYPQPDVTHSQPTPNQVIAAVARVHELPLARLLSSQRDQHLVAARHAAMALLREIGLTLPEIGRALNRDHSTIHHGLAVGKERGPAGLRLDACRLQLGLAQADGA